MQLPTGVISKPYIGRVGTTASVFEPYPLNIRLIAPSRRDLQLAYRVARPDADVATCRNPHSFCSTVASIDTNSQAIVGIGSPDIYESCWNSVVYETAKQSHPSLAGICDTTKIEIPINPKVRIWQQNIART
jgi:hypothetical protein